MKPAADCRIGDIDPKGVRLALAPADFRGGGLGAFQIEIADGDARAFFRRRIARPAVRCRCRRR